MRRNIRHSQIIRHICVGVAAIAAATGLGTAAAVAVSDPANGHSGRTPAQAAQGGGTCALAPNTSYSYRNFDYKLGDCNGKDLHGIRFNQVNLRGANFAGSNLEGATFTASDSYTFLDGSSLRNANLRGAQFYRVVGTGVNFSGADMERADVRQADVAHGTFDGANLQGARFDSVGVRDGSWTSANLTGATLIVSDFSNGNFAHATLNRTDLRSSDFIGNNFQGVNASTGPTTLGRIDFTFGWTNFARANFRSANLGSFDIRGDWVVGAGTCHTIMPDGRENNRNC